VDTGISREWRQDLQQLTEAYSISLRILTGETKFHTQKHDMFSMWGFSATNFSNHWQQQATFF
jgi:hypothetical protein